MCKYQFNFRISFGILLASRMILLDRFSKLDLDYMKSLDRTSEISNMTQKLKVDFLELQQSVRFLSQKFFRLSQCINYAFKTSPWNHSFATK